MKCLRIYATPDGESHFDEVELPTTTRSVHPVAVPFEVSASRQASASASPASQRAWARLLGIRFQIRCLQSGRMVRLNTRRATERCGSAATSNGLHRRPS